MKRITALFLCLCMSLLLLSACGETPSAGSGDGGSHVEMLRIGTTVELDSLKAVSNSGLNYTGFCDGNMFSYDETGKLIPTMLESYEISEDNQTLTLVIPTDCQWHDGEPLTIQDLKFTFEYNRDVVQKRPFLLVDDLQVQGDDTLVVHFAEGMTAFKFINDISIRSRIYPEHIWKDVPDPYEYTGDDINIGCGPYKLVDLDSDARVATYEAVPDYWRGELTVDKIMVKTYASDEALVMGMANDEIDAMYVYSKPIPASLYETVEKYDDLDLGKADDTGNKMMMMGFRAAPTDDLAFREAISYAIDYEQLALAVGGKYATVGHRGVIPASNEVYYNPDLPQMEMNYDKAAQMLDEAGYVDADGDGWRDLKDGSPMEVSIVPQYGQSQTEANIRIGDILEQSFAQVQVKGVFNEECLTSEEAWSQIAEKDGSYNIHLGYCTSGMATFIGVPSYLIDASINQWWGTCKDPEFLAAYDKLSTVADFDEYAQIMMDIQQIIADEVIAIPTCWETAAYPYRTDKIDGWVNRPGEGVINCNTWYNLSAK